MFSVDNLLVDQNWNQKLVMLMFSVGGTLVDQSGHQKLLMLIFWANC
jgi:hypothetical protein